MNAPDMAAALEAAFNKARTEAEAKRAAQLAADSVPTDNVTVLRERATRHAYQAVDEYWGHFNDIQTALTEQVITPLLHTVSRIVAERDEARARVCELERPAVEAKRAEIRQSYIELSNQAQEDRDYEGAFDVDCRLREREEQWKADDEGVTS